MTPPWEYLCCMYFGTLKHSSQMNCALLKFISCWNVCSHVRGPFHFLKVPLLCGLCHPSIIHHITLHYPHPTEHHHNIRPCPTRDQPQLHPKNPAQHCPSPTLDPAVTNPSPTPVPAMTNPSPTPVPAVTNPSPIPVPAVTNLLTVTAIWLPAVLNRSTACWWVSEWVPWVPILLTTSPLNSTDSEGVPTSTWRV